MYFWMLIYPLTLCISGALSSNIPTKDDVECSFSGKHYWRNKLHRRHAEPHQLQNTPLKSGDPRKDESRNSRATRPIENTFFGFIKPGIFETIRKGYDILRPGNQEDEWNEMYKDFTNLPHSLNEIPNMDEKRNSEDSVWIVRSVISQIKEHLGEYWIVRGIDKHYIEDDKNTAFYLTTSTRYRKIKSKNTFHYFHVYPLHLIYYIPGVKTISPTLELALIPGRKPENDQFGVLYIGVLYPDALTAIYEYVLVDAIKYKMNFVRFKLDTQKMEYSERITDLLKRSTSEKEIKKRRLYKGGFEWISIFDSFYEYQEVGAMKNIEKVAYAFEEFIRESSIEKSRDSAARSHSAVRKLKGKITNSMETFEKLNIRSSKPLTRQSENPKHSQKPIQCFKRTVYASLQGSWIVRKNKMLCNLRIYMSGLALLEGPPADETGSLRYYFLAMETREIFQIIDRILVLIANNRIEIVPDKISKSVVRKTHAKYMKKFIDNPVILPNSYAYKDCKKFPLLKEENLGIELSKLVEIEPKNFQAHPESVYLQLRTIAKAKERFLQRVPDPQEFKLGSGFSGKRYEGQSSEWTTIVFSFLNSPDYEDDRFFSHLRSEFENRNLNQMSNEIASKMSNNNFVVTCDKQIGKRRITVLASHSGWEITSKKLAGLFSCGFESRSTFFEVLMAVVPAGKTVSAALNLHIYYLASSIDCRTNACENHFELLDRFEYDHRTGEIVTEFIRKDEIKKAHEGIKLLAEYLGLKYVEIK